MKENKNMKPANQLILSILILSGGLSIAVMLIDNHQVLESILTLITGCIIGLLGLKFILKHYSVISLIDQELMNEDKFQKDLVYKSIIVSLMMVFYSFLVIGSSYSSTNEVLNALSVSIRIAAIINGLYLFYVNFYFYKKYANKSRVMLNIVALLLFALSLMYNLFVSSVTIIDLF